LSTYGTSTHERVRLNRYERRARSRPRSEASIYRPSRQLGEIGAQLMSRLAIRSQLRPVRADAVLFLQRRPAYSTTEALTLGVGWRHILAGGSSTYGLVNVRGAIQA